MNQTGFGDSFDIVKRFFIETVKGNGYSVYADPMFTGAWRSETDFFRFIGAQKVNGAAVVKPSALFVDPDAGIGNRPSKRHTTIPALVEKLRDHDLVFAFDQAFSRAFRGRAQMLRKLDTLERLQAHGFYYDAHARFLFCSRSPAHLRSMKRALVRTGLPDSRIVSLQG
jgi:hypothetical protein